MNRLWRHVGIGVLTLLMFSAATLRAQAWRKPAHLGFACPAGGRRGETVQVTIGGQYFRNAEAVYVSGQGVSVKIIEHVAPLKQKVISKIRDIIQKTSKELREKAKSEKKPAPSRAEMLREAAERAKKEGVTDKQLAAFKKFTEDRRNPKKQLNPQLTESLIVSVTIDADAEPGLRELRVKTRNGLSNPVRFYVNQYREFMETEPNDKLPAASPADGTPVVLNGQIMPGDVDLFRLKAQKGQRLVVQVRARRITPYLADAVPGWFQATAALYDEKGREVAFADDFRFAPDPVLFYEIPEDGHYYLEIRDSIYRGREDFVYRVVVGELPFVSGVFPLGGQVGKPVKVKLSGWNLPREKTSVTFTPAESGVQTLKALGLPGGFDAVKFQVSELPDRMEKENNDGIKQAEAVTLPMIINGRMDREGDWDVYAFEAKKGRPVVMEVYARRLGSPLDSFLKITDASGKVLASHDDHVDKGEGLVTHHADSLLRFTPPRDDRYYLWIGDTQNKGGRSYGYRLRLSAPRPDFALRITPSAITVLPGQTVPVDVFVQRKDGFDGDVQLTLKDAPKGYRLAGGRLPAGRDSIRLTLTVPFNRTEKMTTLDMEGVAAIDGRTVRRRAVPADDAMQAFIYHHLVPTEKWTLAFRGGRGSGMPAQAVGEPPLQLTPGKTVKLRFQRRGSGPLPPNHTLKLTDPPKGVTYRGMKRVDGAYEVTLAADKTLKPGLKGNLIFEVFMAYQPKDKDGKPRGRKRNVSRGVTPAVPFEVTGL